MGRLLRRLLGPIVDVSEQESVTLVMMFAYSFLAMTAYNILKPITRSQFISQLGADNIPYIPLVAAIAIGVIMQGYSRAAGIIPPRWVIPVAQGAMAGLLVMFWVLFQTGNWMVAAGVLLLRADHGHPPDQPVLDAGQRDLRRAAGQAAVRLHRRAAPAWAASPARRC